MCLYSLMYEAVSRMTNICSAPLTCTRLLMCTSYNFSLKKKKKKKRAFLEIEIKIKKKIKIENE